MCVGGLLSSSEMLGALLGNTVHDFLGSADVVRPLSAVRRQELLRVVGANDRTAVIQLVTAGGPRRSCGPDEVSAVPEDQMDSG